MVEPMTMETEETRPAEENFCVFNVGEREFLLPSSVVVEVLDISLIFPIPGAPEYVCGVVPSRGRIIPAVDLSKIYPIEKPSYANAKLLVVDIGNENIGFICEAAPFFVSFDADIPVEDLIDVKTFFEKYRVKGTGNVKE